MRPLLRRLVAVLRWPGDWLTKDSREVADTTLSQRWSRDEKREALRVACQ